MPTPQAAVRTSILAALRQHLIGPMHDNEVLTLPPSRWYLTGFLVPDNSRHREDPLGGEDLAPGADTQEEDGTSDPAPRERPWLPASFGLSVLVDRATRQLNAEVSYGQYRRLDPQESARLRAGQEDDDEVDDEPPEPGQRVRHCWQRVGERKIPALITLGAPDQTLPLGDGGRELVVYTRDASGHGLPPGTRSVAVFLHNKASQRGGRADEETMFQVELVLRSERGFLARTQLRPGDRDDDRRDDLLYRDRAEYVVGHGVSAAFERPRPGGRVTAVRTAWMPTAHTWPMDARRMDEVPLGMRALAALPSPAALREAMAPLLSRYEAWIDGLQAVPVGEAREVTRARLVADARTCLRRVRDGLDLLVADPLAWEAFQLMQGAMADAAHKARPDREPAWRLFQLAFVLLNLPPAVQEDHPERDRVELLFFPTGGGKTEAYLGVAAFTILHRRLRLGDRGAGVAVLLRYTLRLLTLDQLGRAATLACALELVRARHADRMGEERVRVGLWVGNKATPGTLPRMKEALDEARRRAQPAPVPLTACPWCGAAFDVRTVVVDPHTMRVGCQNTACDFHFDRSDGLPIAFVDDHVYRTLPALLIATVDKFASLPWRAAAGMLLGRVRARHPAHGWYGHGEEAPKDARREADLPPPSLVIQDELHLISGPLGTMVGLYETALEALTGPGTRIIASTATARRAGEQVGSLFGRDRVAMFPPPGLDPDDNFFAVAARDEDRSRQYVGVAAPGRSAKRILTAVMTTLLGAAQAAWREEEPSPEHPADGFMTLAAYFNSLRELGGARRIYQDEVLRRARRARRRAPLQPPEGPLADRQVAFEPLELTSRQSVRDIAHARAALALPHARQQGRQRADVLLASSMISVGIDIPRLALMLVHGQPRTTAEYIQATSRVGRAGPGLVVTLHNLVKPRDRSHYERFQAWHECFYRYVEASSVTPWSMRAVQRGLAGVVTGWLRHRDGRYTPGRGAEEAARPAEVEAQVLDMLERRASRDPNRFPVRTWLGRRVKHLLTAWRTAVTTTRRGGGTLVWSTWDPDAAGRKALLSSAVDPVDPDREQQLLLLRAPTSMRDVEASVHLWVDRPADEPASVDEEEPA